MRGRRSIAAAWLDGKPAEVLRANYVLRAVRVPPGKHELRMRFDPPAFRTGVFLSLGAYLVIAIGFASSFVLDRRTRRLLGEVRQTD